MHHHHPVGLVERHHPDRSRMHDDITLGDTTIRHPHRVPAYRDDPSGEGDLALDDLVAMPGRGPVGHGVVDDVRGGLVRRYTTTMRSHDDTSSSPLRSPDAPRPSRGSIP